MARKATKIKFTKRADTGKGACRKSRAKGIVPAVFYGPEYRESLVGSVDERELSRVADSANWETEMIELEMPDGSSEMALLRNVQRHAVTRNILHVDLYQLVKGVKVRVAVPVRLLNKEVCAGVKMGGMLDHTLREVEITVLPREIPSEITVDTAGMAMGDEVFVRDLELPESADLLLEEDTLVVSVVRPRLVVEETEAEEGAEAEEETEVEVVGKGKRKEEEEE